MAVVAVILDKMLAHASARVSFLMLTAGLSLFSVFGRATGIRDRIQALEQRRACWLMLSQLTPEVREGALLGSGGMGSAYLGELRYPNGEIVHVVIKRPKPIHPLAPDSRVQEQRRSFQKEAELAKAYDRYVLYHESEEGPALIMPNFSYRPSEPSSPGKTIAHYLRESFGGNDARSGGVLASGSPPVVARRQQLSEIFEISDKILVELEKLGKLGIVHRDLKPENVLIRREPGPHDTEKISVKLIDFGISHRGTEYSFAPLEPGTPSYMPPSVIAQLKKPSARDDIFALQRMVFDMVIAAHRKPEETTGAYVRLPTDLLPGRTVLASSPRDSTAGQKYLTFAWFARSAALDTASEARMLLKLAQTSLGLEAYLRGYAPIWAKAWDQAKDNPERRLELAGELVWGHEHALVLLDSLPPAARARILRELKPVLTRIDALATGGESWGIFENEWLVKEMPVKELIEKVKNR